MKFGWLLPVLLLFGLLLAPASASEAAADAALLWWTRVLPSLLPYLITASLIERSGLFSHLPKRLASLLLWLFGALGGYPIGARLCAALVQDGILSEADAKRAIPFVNLPNPIFLISVVALGMFENVRVLVPLLCGVYGVAALGLVPLFRLRLAGRSRPSVRLTADDLPQAIEAGVRAILTIGGCMLFASIVGALICSAGVLRIFGEQQSLAQSLLLGLFEMTCGIRAVSSLSLPLAVRLALCAFLVQFGGGSVLLQTAAQSNVSLPRYAGVKALFAAGSAFLTYALAVWLCPDAVIPTVASRAELLANSASLLSVILAAAVGLLSIFVFTIGLQRKKTP